MKIEDDEPKRTLIAEQWWAGLLLLFLWAIIILVACGLMGCVPPRARIVYHGEFGDYAYSSKSGVTVDIRSLVRKHFEIIPEK